MGMTGPRHLLSLHAGARQLPARASRSPWRRSRLSPHSFLSIRVSSFPSPCVRLPQANLRCDVSVYHAHGTHLESAHQLDHFVLHRSSQARAATATFTTFCDSKLRISRGVARFPSAPTELRIFARDDADQKEWESWQEEEDAKTEASSATAWEEADNDDPYEKYFDEMPD
eukprot:scaffold26008_cov23-Tisochrysis_lutea.AAC.1